jgi:thiamine-monophosphate kinase
VPLSAAARQVLAADPQAIETILTGGDDFEVVAAVPADHVEDFRAEAAETGVALTEIGVVVTGPREAHFMAADGGALAFKRPSYSHF